MPSSLRLKRIADRIRQELSVLLLQEVSDPRLTGISVTDVRVDRELAYADIFVSTLEGVTRSQDVLEGLNHASAYLRRTLATRIELRVFPRLRFHWDPTPERAAHIENLLSEIRSQAETSEERNNQTDEN